MAVVAMLAVGCGLKITGVTFSTHEPEQNSTMTIKTTYVTTDDNHTDKNNHNPQSDYYLLYAVRVPSDWSGESLAATILKEDVYDESTGELTETHDPADLEMVECPNYAKFCEFCFPRDGYKWVAWQSKEARHQGTEDETMVTLKVGQAMGDYTLDIMTGGWKYELSELVNENGDINLNVAFGCNFDRTDFNEKTENFVALYFNTSEYLFNASTISEEEYKNRIELMRNSVSTTVTVTKDGKPESKTMPVAPDIANLYKDADMSVKVKQGAGIEGVAVDATGGAAEYFDLQGRKVADPKAGLYLVKRGGKVAKEIVK